jgi:hypothetical protein
MENKDDDDDDDQQMHICRMYLPHTVHHQNVTIVVVINTV